MDIQSNEHHLVLGQLNDFLTGQVLADTLDERYRQKIAKKLVLDKGFVPSDICSNKIIEVVVGSKKARLKIDFLVHYEDHIICLIKYAPGSLVTRRLSTLALSRIVVPYQIPIAIITNGEDAEIIDGHTGCVIATGLESLLDKKSMIEKIETMSFDPIHTIMFDKASRIAYACEVESACPCDTDVCIINE
ncbi:MAG: type I restriction enzyme HsdR N-terminal domain-containing protein [Pseudomonadota bacterium]